MRQPTLVATALGVALFGLPALAQQATLHHDSLDGQRGPIGVAMPGQERDAATADRLAATQGPMGWLKEAQEATRGGRLGEANELLERAETRLLSRVTPAPMADRPMQGPLLQHSAAARAALTARDRDSAMQHIELAMQAADAMAGSGTSTGTLPMQGGSMLPQDEQGMLKARPGSAVLRERGEAGTSLARADRLGAPTLPPGPLLRVQSGQAPANSMGESQRASPGQPMPRAASPNVAPPGRSTMPAVPRTGANAPTRGNAGNPTTAPNAAGSNVTGGTPGGGTN